MPAQVTIRFNNVRSTVRGADLKAGFLFKTATSAGERSQQGLKSLLFCQQPLQGNLDNYRFLAKNTLELIVLPVLRQVLLAETAAG